MLYYLSKLFPKIIISRNYCLWCGFIEKACFTSCEHFLSFKGEYLNTTLRSVSNILISNMMLWSDESSFKCHRIFNMYNLLHWAIDNPRVMGNVNVHHHVDVNLIINNCLVGSSKISARIEGS